MNKTYEHITIVSVVLAFIVSGVFIGAAAAVEGAAKWLFVALFFGCMLYIAGTTWAYDLSKKKSEDIDAILRGEWLH